MSDYHVQSGVVPILSDDDIAALRAALDDLTSEARRSELADVLAAAARAMTMANLRAKRGAPISEPPLILDAERWTPEQLYTALGLSLSLVRRFTDGALRQFAVEVHAAVVIAAMTRLEQGF